jgi:FkbM family methyltransferase
MLTTAQKVSIARAAYKILITGRKALGLASQTHTRRGGICWALDLREGIDISIYLLGSFEPRTQRLYRKLVKPGDTILDIGANIGSHTLPLAQLVGSQGRVFAFEPTRFAYHKLLENMELNPELKGRISAQQILLTAPSQKGIPPALFASWPLTGSSEVDPQHKGRRMPTSGADAKTLDEIASQQDMDRLKLIKLDVDGHESFVLSGAIETLKRHRPDVLLELAPYLFCKEELCRMVEIFRGLDYIWVDANTGEPLPLDAEELWHLVPAGASRNVLARLSRNISATVE